MTIPATAVESACRPKSALIAPKAGSMRSMPSAASAMVMASSEVNSTRPKALRAAGDCSDRITVRIVGAGRVGSFGPDVGSSACGCAPSSPAAVVVGGPTPDITNRLRPGPDLRAGANSEST